MTRALKFQSNLPTSLWGECLLTSTYLINRIPHSVLNFKTPYEKLFETPPSYDNLKVFGCQAFMSVHSSDKLAPRAIATVFVGYPMNTKGYKLYDPVTKLFHTSRHVSFKEDVFPFKQCISPNSVPFNPHFSVNDTSDSPLDYFPPSTTGTNSEPVSSSQQTQTPSSSEAQTSSETQTSSEAQSDSCLLYTSPSPRDRG